MGWYDYGYPPYVPVAERRARARREVAKRIKRGESISPVEIVGRTIASTFWGKAWCTNLEGYSDYANRLPRGRTYVRNGSVVHLKVGKGRIEALVSGSEMYEIQIDIGTLPQQAWRALKAQSAGKIGTLVELLQGKLSKAVMELVTARDQGLFPKPQEIKMRCSCPDGARMCKHLAAVMYGVGNRLDSSPELLFVLRGVDHLELIEQAIPTAPPRGSRRGPTISADDLGSIFDIEIGDDPVATKAANVPKPPSVKKAPQKKTPSAPKAVAKAKPAAKQVVKKAPQKKTPSTTKAVAKAKPAAKQVVKKAPQKKTPPATKKKSIGS